MIVCALACIALYAPQGSASLAPTELKASATKIVNRFLERTHTPAAKAPKVVVKFDPSISSYYLKNNTLYTTAWGQCPTELKALAKTWAGHTKGKVTDEELFRELFAGS